jgi:hypothetical protein
MVHITFPSRDPACHIMGSVVRRRVDIPASGRACVNEPHQRMPNTIAVNRVVRTDEPRPTFIQSTHQTHPRRFIKRVRYVFGNINKDDPMICRGVGPREVRRPLGFGWRRVVYHHFSNGKKKEVVRLDDREQLRRRQASVVTYISNACHR